MPLAPDTMSLSRGGLAWLGWRHVALMATCLLAGMGVALVGLDHGLPEAPWGEEQLRWLQLLVGALNLVLRPWQDVDPDALSPAPLARWALPVALVAVLLDLGRFEVMRRWRIRRMGRQGGHVVVIGVSALAQHLMTQWSARGRQIVVLSEEPLQRAAVLAAGAAWVQGSAADEAALLRAHAAAAERVVLVADDDTRNIADALRVASFCAHNRSPDASALMMWVRIEDPFLATSLEPRLVGERAAEVVEQKVFSAGQIAARRLLRDWPGFLHTSEGRVDNVWAMVGATPIAEALIVQALRAEVVREAARPVFVIVAPDAEDFVARMRSRWPGLHVLAKVLVLPLRTEQADEACEAMAALVGMPDIACFCHDGGTTNVAAAVSWADAWRTAGQCVPPLYLHAPDGRTAPVVEEVLPGVVVRSFGNHAIVADELVSGDRLDAMARCIHEGYLRVALGQGEVLGARRSLQPWRGLSEDLRTDNRVVADHHFTKILRAGWTVVPSGTGAPLVWSPEVIEAQARLEHERWMRHRMLLGWQAGRQRDDARRIHPDLVPYEDLTEDRKELDRDVVRQLPTILTDVGIAVHPTRRLLVMGPPSPWAFAPLFEARIAEVMQRVFADVPVSAQVLWIHGSSAMAWRVAELWWGGGGRRLGVVYSSSLRRVLSAPSSVPTEKRIRAMVSRATETLRLEAGSDTEDAGFRCQRELQADAVLSLFIEPPAAARGAHVWQVGADGQLLVPGTTRFEVTA